MPNHLKNTALLFSAYLSLLLLIFSACKPDEPTPRKYPRVRTISLGKLDSTGLSITGEIFELGSSAIKDHGFMWSDNQNKDISESDTFSLGSTDQTGTFTQHIPQFRFEGGKRYIIRSYLISDEHTVIGNFIPFKASGSPNPKIIEIKPDSGIVADTITLITQDLPSALTLLDIYFGSRKARQISITRDSIVCIVPPGLPREPVNVFIRTQSNQSYPSSGKFTSLVPKIESISPQQGTFYDRVEITGKNFHPRAEANIVRFGGQVVGVNSGTTTSLTVEVPVQTSSSSSKISVQVEAQIGNSTQEFQLTPPVINSISPSEGMINSTLEIQGDFFNPLLYHTKAWVGNLPAQIVSGDRTTIQIRIPLGVYPTRITPIRLEVSGISIQSSQNFEISSAFISRSEIPNQDSRYGRSQPISFTLNGEAYMGLGGPRSSASVKEWKDLWKFDPSTLTWSSRADFPGQGTFAATGFTIGNIAYVGLGQSINRGIQISEFYAYDPSGDQWTSRSPFPGPLFNGFGSKGFSIGDKGYIITQGTNGQNFWEYNAQLDSWSPKASLPYGANDTKADIALSMNSTGYVITSNSGTDRIWEYDPVNDTWTPKAPLPIPADEKTGFVFEDKIYVLSSLPRNNLGNYLYRYEESTDTWTNVSYMGAPRLIAATSFQAGNRIFVTGGDFNFGLVNKYVWEFEPNP